MLGVITLVYLLLSIFAGSTTPQEDPLCIDSYAEFDIVPVLPPISVADTSETSCTMPSMLPTNTFPTLSLSLTNWSLPMEQESTSPVIRTAAVNSGHGCLLQL